MSFVGRERELALLAESLHRAASGRHGHVLLSGSAGQGCTRLLDELTHRVAELPGVRIARGRAHEPMAGLPFQAVGDALATALREIPAEALPDVLGRGAHDLCGVVPGLADRLDELGIERAPPRLEAPDQLGKRVVESIVGVLEHLAGDGVLLLVLEDLHRADPATRGLAGTLVGIGRPLRVALVVSVQSDELHRRHPMRALAAALRDDPEVVAIDLGPLSGPEVERLVEGDLGMRPTASVLSAIVAGARGEPLMALQLARAAVTLEGIPLSDPLDQLILARLEALPTGAQRAVRLLAAARRPLSRVELRSVRSAEGIVTPRDVTAGVESGLLAEHDGTVCVAHDLLAEAIEAADLPPERQARHAALAEIPGVSPAVAAWHWAHAGRTVLAHAAHVAAAEQARVVDPGETTLSHLVRALEMPGAAPVWPDDQGPILVAAARASAAAGSSRRAAVLMRRAITARAASSRGDRMRTRGTAVRAALADLHEQLARYQWAGGDLQAAIAALGKAEALTPADAEATRARVLAALSQFLMIEGRFEASLPVARRARAAAEAAIGRGDDARRELASTACTLGVDVAYLGDLDAGLVLLEEAAVVARSAGRLDDLMRVAANRTTLLDLDSRREAALAVVTEGIRDAAEGGLSGTYGAFLRGNAADILFQLGRWPEAERECRAAMEWSPASLAWSSPVLYLGLLLAESRADEEAAGLVGQALLQLENVPAGQLGALLERAAVSLALWRGEAADALAIAERAWPRVLETDDPAQIALAASTSLEAAAAAASVGRLERDFGMLAAARELSERVLPEAERRVREAGLPEGLGARAEADLHLATARAHRDRLRGASDPAAWDALAGAWTARGLPYPVAKARWWQALSILEWGAQRDEATEAEREAARAAAREPLSESLVIARSLGALPLVRAVIDLAARARISLPAGGERVAAIPIRPDSMVGMPKTDGREATAAQHVAVGPGSIGSQPRPGDARGGEVARLIEERILASLRNGPRDSYGLSPRERDVLEVLAEGRTDRDIAARLFISERTVHVHVRRILAKLGVSSRTEAASLAIRQGLVPEITPLPAGRQARSDPALP
jgi:DNA-binding CsgD family transcriptional regulator/tetratricopeptide (TPR) repeat protein